MEVGTNPNLSIQQNYSFPIPDDVLLKIFHLFVDFKDLSSAHLVCHHWKVLSEDASFMFKEMNAFKVLISNPPRSTPWKYFSWEFDQIKFSSISKEIISFYPQDKECRSHFFSFENHPPFSKEYIFLNQLNDTYFLSKTKDYDLYIINFKNPKKNNKINFSAQIVDCFPFSDSKIAIVTTKHRISLWDLSKGTPECYKKFNIDPWPSSGFHKVGNHLIFDNKQLDLNTSSLMEHEYNFTNMVTFGSSMCTFDGCNVEYFLLDDEKGIKKIWNFSFDLSDGHIFYWSVQGINEKYIAIEYYKDNSLFRIILNTNGELLLKISQQMDEFKVRKFSMTKLSGDILICANSKEAEISFWHLPTKTLIQKIDWTKCLDIACQGSLTELQDISLAQGKLTLLLSLKDEDTNQNIYYRILQFDPQYKPSTQGFMEMASNRITSTVKTICSYFKSSESFAAV